MLLFQVFDELLDSLAMSFFLLNFCNQIVITFLSRFVALHQAIVPFLIFILVLRYTSIFSY